MQSEIVVMGRGLGRFKKRLEKRFDSQKVEKTFILETQVFLKSLQDYKGYSELYLNIASKNYGLCTVTASLQIR